MYGTSELCDFCLQRLVKMVDVVKTVSIDFL